MGYELWESTGGNIIADFQTEQEALEVVRLALEAGSRSSVDTWLLVYEDDRGEVNHIAAGDALLGLAKRAPA